MKNQANSNQAGQFDQRCYCSFSLSTLQRHSEHFGVDLTRWCLGLTPKHCFLQKKKNACHFVTRVKQFRFITRSLMRRWFSHILSLASSTAFWKNKKGLWRAKRASWATLKLGTFSLSSSAIWFLLYSSYSLSLSFLNMKKDINQIHNSGWA